MTTDLAKIKQQLCGKKDKMDRKAKYDINAISMETSRQEESQIQIMIELKPSQNMVQKSSSQDGSKGDGKLLQT